MDEVFHFEGIAFKEDWSRSPIAFKSSGSGTASETHTV